MQDFTIVLPGQDVQIIMSALAELPLKVSSETYTKMQKQLAEQSAKREPALADESANEDS